MSDDEIQKIVEFNDNETAPLSDNDEDQAQTNDLQEEEQYDDDDDEEIGEPIADDDSIVQLKCHTDEVYRVCVSDSMRWLASGSKDNSALVWDLNSQKGIFYKFNYLKFKDLTPFMSITEHEESVDYIAFNGKSTLLASGDISGKIVCTNLLNKSQLCVVKKFKKILFTILD